LVSSVNGPSASKNHLLAFCFRLQKGAAAGVAHRDFNAAIAQFIEVLGQQNVLTQDQQLAPYMKTMMAVPESEHAPSAALIATEVAQAGYGVYRVNTAFMEKVADIYGPVKRKIDQTIKQALDPNGIIAPGKSGIV
jgi:hypothetical protein